MKVFYIPEDLRTIIFDIDGTLYTSPQFVAEQVDVQVRHYAHINGMSEDEARKKINLYRSEWSASHGGKKISLGNTFTAFGIDIDTSIEWRNRLLAPEKYLSKNQTLCDCLVALKKQYTLICVTNNPVYAATKTLKAIGLDKTITNIVGLDTCKKSKPSEDILKKACDITGTPCKNCLAVGDRYDIDLDLPLKMGMGAVLVDGDEDVCRLAETLMQNKN